MGMAYVTAADDTPRRSTLYPTCFYCPRCDATYTPNLEWGTVVGGPKRGDTTGQVVLANVQRLGDECPFCRRKPETGAAKDGEQ